MLVRAEVKVTSIRKQQLLKRFFSLFPDIAKTEVPIGDTFIVTYDFGTKDLQLTLQRLRLLRQIVRVSRKSTLYKSNLTRAHEILRKVDRALDEIALLVDAVE